MSRRVVFFAVVIAMVALPAGGGAQQGSVKDPQAVAVLQRAVAALGANAGNVSTAVAVGTYTGYLVGGRTVSYGIKLIAQTPDRIRWETTKADGVVTIAINGNTGWMQAGGQIKLFSLSDMAGRGFEKFPLGVLAAWIADPNINLRYAGRVSGSSNDFDQLRISKGFSSLNLSAQTKQLLELDTQADWYFDVASGLPAWVRFYQDPAKYGQKLPQDLAFSDFRDIGGVLMPMTVTNYIRQQMTSVVRFQNVQLNVAVSINEFKR